MAHARAQTPSSICFMFGLKERPYPGREPKSFWCDSDNKNLDFFMFLYFSRYFCFAHFDHHQNLVIYRYTPTRIISKYLQYAYWPFSAFSSFFNKIQDGRQNPMSLSRAWTALWICFMFGLRERPYSAHVVISFWCDSDIRNYNFSRFRILADISVLFILAIIKIC